VIDRLIDAAAGWTIRATGSRSSCWTTRPTRRWGGAGDCRALCAGICRAGAAADRASASENRYGYKAGALDEGLKVARGELIAIFDADFVPPPDWLMKVVHHFAEPGSAWCRRAGRT
jgi:hypothetical protein